MAVNLPDFGAKFFGSLNQNRIRREYLSFVDALIDATTQIPEGTGGLTGD